MLSPLLVPCDDPGTVAEAMRSGVDALVLDLGDADAPGDRAARRRTALAALLRRGAGAAADALHFHGGDRRTEAPKGARPTTILRVAPLASGLVDADLDAAMAGAPDAVLLPGTIGARDLQHLAAKLAVREAEHGAPAGRTRVLAAAADTAAGALALAALPGATPRLLALVWDPVALAACLRVPGGASPLRAARDALLMVAAAAGVPAFDRGFASDDLAAACRLARRDGFAGRIARGPHEAAAIAAAFA